MARAVDELQAYIKRQGLDGGDGHRPLGRPDGHPDEERHPLRRGAGGPGAAARAIIDGLVPALSRTAN